MRSTVTDQSPRGLGCLTRRVRWKSLLDRDSVSQPSLSPEIFAELTFRSSQLLSFRL